LRSFGAGVQVIGNWALNRLLSAPVDRGSDAYVLPESRGHGGVDDLADYWRDSSLLIHGVARALGARYLHVLQPQPHFGSRRMTEIEETFIQRDHPYSRTASHAYPKLIQRAAELREKGVAIVLAHALFDNISGPVYADLVHQNLRGAEVLADFFGNRNQQVRQGALGDRYSLSGDLYLHVIAACFTLSRSCNIRF